MPAATQLSLLDAPGPDLPDGFEYRPELIATEDETELIERFRLLDFKPFQFHGYFGNRRVVSFGWHYDFTSGRVRPAAGIPDYLMPLREKAATFARIDPAALEHALLTEYASGAAIGWHRDRPAFAEVIGISLGAPCRFRLRRKRGKGWERATIGLQPRSAYVLRGPARRDWEHSIPPLEERRYSVTFRSLTRPTKGARG